MSWTTPEEKIVHKGYTTHEWIVHELDCSQWKIFVLELDNSQQMDELNWNIMILIERL